MTKKKSVFKTTTEYTYNDKGRVIKEVQVVEEWQEDMVANITGGGIIASGTSRTDAINVPYKTSVGVPPHTISYDTVGELKLPPNTITQIANEVKAQIDRDVRLTPKKL